MLASYQVKEVAQILYIQWRDNRALRAGHITRGAFRRVFLDRVFLMEKREDKIKEVINLLQGGIGV